MNNLQQVLDTVSELQECPEILTENTDILTHLDLLQKSTEELQQILQLDDEACERWLKDLTLDDIIHATFTKAHVAIRKLPIKKRITFLAELNYKMEYLYTSTTEYNDKGFGHSMSPKVFQQIMGKIKHLEILQAWLFGIE